MYKPYTMKTTILLLVIGIVVADPTPTKPTPTLLGLHSADDLLLYVYDVVLTAYTLQDDNTVGITGGAFNNPRCPEGGVKMHNKCETPTTISPPLPNLDYSDIMFTS